MEKRERERGREGEREGERERGPTVLSFPLFLEFWDCKRLGEERSQTLRENERKKLQRDDYGGSEV
jgi:hypothetical protein